MNSVVYTPKSKFHIDFGWQFAFTEAVGCPRQRDLLQQVLYFSQKDSSTFTNAIGEQYQGMLVNYEHLSAKLGMSRRTLQNLLKQLANDGYIIKFKLNNNRILVQATDKAFDLLDAVHEESLAAKTSENDFETLSHNFDVIKLPQPKSQARQNLHSLDNKLGKNYIAPLYSNRLNREKTIYSLKQELNSIGEDKPNDCANVDFFENDIANGRGNTKQNTLVVECNDDLKQATIAYLKAQCPDVPESTITKTIDGLTARFSLTSQHEIVNAVLMTLGKITEDEAWEYDQQGVCAVVSSVEAEIKDSDSDNNNAANLMDAFAACNTALRGAITKGSTTQHNGGSAMKRSTTSTTNYNNDKIKVANQGYHRDSVAEPTAEDLKMAVVEKEVLRKDRASLADQNFYEGVLPDCQKIALVAIIDYVKRKGIVIGSDQEIYRWLYHTASNHQHYYSRATNFKHLANILIKQLMNKKFEKPSGFNAWEQRIKQQIGCSSMLQKE